LSVLTFGATEASRTVATVLSVFVGIVGMGRLGGRLGLRGPGRYLAGLVLMAGPGTAVLAGNGSWTALFAAALLPWLVRAVRVPDGGEGPGSFGWVLVLSVPTAAFAPLLTPVPLLMALLLSPRGSMTRRLVRGLVALAGVAVAVPFLIGHPEWMLDAGQRILPIPNRIWVGLIDRKSTRL